MKRQFNKLIKGIGQPPARARRGFGLVLAGMALALVPQSGRSGTEGETAHTSLARASATTVWSQIGARSGAEYKGDGLTVIPVPQSGSARLRCVFQRLEGDATGEGLWLTSTAISLGGTASDRFRVVAVAVGRAESERSAGFPVRSILGSWDGSEQLWTGERARIRAVPRRVAPLEASHDLNSNRLKRNTG